MGECEFSLFSPNRSDVIVCGCFAGKKNAIKPSPSTHHK